VEGTTGTVHLVIRNPTGAHFVLAARADGWSDPELVDLPPGETTAELALDHLQLFRAAAYGFGLLVEVRPAEASADAHFAPDRPIGVQATLRVAVPPAN
jgi:hypothetical protein